MTASFPPVRFPDPLRDEFPLGSPQNPASLDDDMGFDDDLLPLGHPAMRDAYAKWNEARLSDAELVGASRQHNRYNRENRK
jgi:hypothetical protein